MQLHVFWTSDHTFLAHTRSPDRALPSAHSASLLALPVPTPPSTTVSGFCCVSPQIHGACS